MLGLQLNPVIKGPQAGMDGTGRGVWGFISMAQHKTAITPVR